MSTSRLEQARAAEEAIERLERAMSLTLEERDEVTRTFLKSSDGSMNIHNNVNVSNLSSKLARHGVGIDKQLVFLCQRIKQESKNVIKLYEDKDNLRSEETDYIAGLNNMDNMETSDQQQTSNNKLWQNFYESIKTLKKYHRSNPVAGGFPERKDIEYYRQRAREDCYRTLDSGLFSIEENYGKRVDLEKSGYEKFVNLKKYREYRKKRWEIKHGIVRGNNSNVKKGNDKNSKGLANGVNGTAPVANGTSVNGVANGTVVNGTSDTGPTTTSSVLSFETSGGDIDYITWLSTFTQFHEIPRYCKLQSSTNIVTGSGPEGGPNSSQPSQCEYKDYLDSIISYLESFLKRSSPLKEKSLEDSIKPSFENEFERDWEVRLSTINSGGGASMDQSQTMTSIPKGWEIPTWNDRYYVRETDKLFPPNINILNAHKEGKQYKKAAERYAQNLMNSSNDSNAISFEEQMENRMNNADKELCKREAWILKLVSSVEEIKEGLIESRKRLQLKQAMTAQELEEEQMELERLEAELSQQNQESLGGSNNTSFNNNSSDHNTGGLLTAVREIKNQQMMSKGNKILDGLNQNIEMDDSDDEGSDSEERAIYNPMKLPTGWDGKPIPYWLYKLHNLGKEYKCEICGNFSYWGPKAFYQHFSEFRHSNSMRALKIPNTRHFREITSISDAYALYEKLKQEAGEGEFIQDSAECEDAQGNVMSKRAFDDLRKQGLV